MGFQHRRGLAMATALIPVLSAYTGSRDHENVSQLASTVINWVFIAVTVGSGLAAIFAPHIIRLLAPGFDKMRAELATRLMRLVLLQTVVSSISVDRRGASFTSLSTSPPGPLRLWPIR